MNQQELEEFAHFLKLAELSGAGNGDRRLKNSWWSSFHGKTTISCGMFATAVVLFRSFGHTLA